MHCLSPLPLSNDLSSVSVYGPDVWVVLELPSSEELICWHRAPIITKKSLTNNCVLCLMQHWGSFLGKLTLQWGGILLPLKHRDLSEEQAPDASPPLPVNQAQSGSHWNCVDSLQLRKQLHFHLQAFSCCRLCAAACALPDSRIVSSLRSALPPSAPRAVVSGPARTKGQLKPRLVMHWKLIFRSDLSECCQKVLLSQVSFWNGVGLVFFKETIKSGHTEMCF